MKVINPILFTLMIITVAIGASQAFSQNLTGKPDDGLKEKTDMTLLKDGSEKAHVKEKAPKKSPTPSHGSTDSAPSTKGLPTDVD